MVTVQGGTATDLLYGSSESDKIFGDVRFDLRGQAQGGADTVFGGAGADKLYGDAGDDLRDRSRGGDDQLFGGAGADRLYGDAGDEISQSAVGGDDRMFGGRGDDKLYGDAGFDLLGDARGGDDALFGGAGADALYGDAGNDFGTSADSREDAVRGGDDRLAGGSGGDRLYGDAGDDLRDSSRGGDDLLFGGAGADRLYGDAGDDISQSAEGGDDRLVGGRGADKLYGDAGDDLRDSARGGDDALYGGAGADRLYGDAGDEISQSAEGGDDRLVGGRGADKLFGDAGFDLLGEARGGDDDLFGGAGSDALYGDAGNDFGTSADSREDAVQGGDDRLSGGRGSDRLYGDAGDDLRDSARGGDDALYGGAGADRLYGDAGDEISQSAEGGDDRLVGGRGSDQLFGDAGFDLLGDATGGDDVLYGGAGADALYGDAGNDFGTSADSREDQVRGGDDWLFGGSGDDALYGDAGDDLRDSAEGGDDQLYGGAGDDRLFGDAGDEITQSAVGGDDTLYGGRGDDSLIGNSGDDLLFGGDQDDRLDGGAGNDALYGGAGGDTLSGGVGSSDTLFGGEGSDTLFGDQATGGPSGDNDVVYGGDDADTIDGGAGDDSLFGGDGTDVALFSGDLTAEGYEVTTSGGITVVVDLDPSDGDDGTTTLQGVEILRFADQDLVLSDSNAAPVLGANSLTLVEGDTVVLGAADLSANDSDSNDADLIFTVSNVQQGQFELVSSPGFAVTGFSQAQVTAGDIQFVHDGGELPPAYDVSVSDGVASTTPAAAAISFTNQNDAPVLGANSLTLDEGGVVVLDGTVLSANDSDSNEADLIFTVSNVQQGQFELVSSPGFAVTGFSQAQVTAGDIQFVHDGGELPPAYDVSVSDGLASTTPAAAAVSFTNQNDAPVLGANSLTLDEGEMVVLDGSDLSASDIDSDDPSLVFTVSNVQQGQFELTSAPGIAITSFTQAQVTAGVVEFVHDGGELPPSYDVSVSDGVTSTAPVPATVSFTNENDPPVLGANSLTVGEGATVVLSDGFLSASDADHNDSDLVFTVSNVRQGSFELVAAPGTPVTSFTQAQVADGAVQFVHDGGDVAPSYDVSVSDGVTSTLPAAATVDFTGENDPPVLGANSLIIGEGETVVLDGGFLSASDADDIDGDLIFTVSNVQQGRFELTSCSNAPPDLRMNTAASASFML